MQKLSYLMVESVIISTSSPSLLLWLSLFSNFLSNGSSIFWESRMLAGTIDTVSNQSYSVVAQWMALLYLFTKDIPSLLDYLCFQHSLCILNVAWMTLIVSQCYYDNSNTLHNAPHFIASSLHYNRNITTIIVMVFCL